MFRLYANNTLSYIRYIRIHRFEYLWERSGAFMSLQTAYACICVRVCVMAYHIPVSFHFFHIFMSSQYYYLQALYVHNSISSRIFVLCGVSDLLFLKLLSVFRQYWNIRYFWKGVFQFGSLVH